MASNLMILKRVGANSHYVNVALPAGMYNGYAVGLGVKNSDGTYASAAATAVTQKSVVILADEAISYEAEKLMNDKVFATGEIGRCLVLSKGDVITVPQANIVATNALAAAKFVTIKANSLPMECIDALGGTEQLSFVIESLYTKSGVLVADLRCIQTEQ